MALTAYEKVKRWRERHPEAWAEQRKRYAERHPEKAAERQQRYSERHREERAAKALARYHANAKELNRQAYDRLGPAGSKAKNAKRRARENGVAGELSATDIQDLFREQEGRCYYCRKRLAAFELDHKVPLSRDGSNDRANVALACRTCNQRKGQMTEEEFRHRRKGKG